MNDSERREAIERYLRQTAKPYIKRTLPRVCAKCGAEQGVMTWGFAFGRGISTSRSFRAICLMARRAVKK